MITLLFHFLTVLVGPIFFIGLINRTKAFWSGRKGPRLNQAFFDLLRLFRKVPVFSSAGSWIFQFAPWLVLATSLAAASLSPIVPGYTPHSFPYDFIYFTYLLGLGRAFLILGAIDTGSSFEGMGASREATFSALIEPVLLFVVGTMGILSGHTSFQDLMVWNASNPVGYLSKVTLVSALILLLQVESARVPVDDPTTHLELTMIHEVMILDNSGPELGAIQYGAAIKMTLIAGLIAAVINPISATENPFMSFGISISIMSTLAIAVGLIESLIARIRLRSIPAYILIGVLLGILSLILGIGSRKGVV